MDGLSLLVRDCSINFQMSDEFILKLFDGEPGDLDEVVDKLGDRLFPL